MILDGIDVFTEVVEAQSFSRAARRLGMPTSTVSARIARLEERLGATLIRRTTRQLSVTPLGQAYYRRCVRALAELAEAEREMAEHSEEPAGLLRITAPADIAQFKLVPLVGAFLARYPRASVDLSVTNRQLDLIGEGIDLAVRVSTLPDSSLVATRFFEAHVGLWAAPEYVARRGLPDRLADLAGHELVAMSRAGGILKLRDRAAKVVDLPTAGRIVTDDMQSCRAFVASGAGIGLLPDFIGGFDAPRLVRVLPELSSLPIVSQFVYPAQRFLPKTLRAFIDLARDDRPN